MFLISYIALWAVVLVETALLIIMFRELGRIYLVSPERLTADGPAVGSDIGEIVVHQHVNGTHPLPREPFRSSFGGRRALLLFNRSSCQYCAEAYAAAAAWADRHADWNLVVAASEADVGCFSTYADAPSLVGLSPATVEQLALRVSPFCVVVDEECRVTASGVINDESAIDRLVGVAESPPLVVTHVIAEGMPRP